MPTHYHEPPACTAASNDASQAGRPHGDFISCKEVTRVVDGKEVQRCECRHRSPKPPPPTPIPPDPPDDKPGRWDPPWSPSLAHAKKVRPSQHAPKIHVGSPATGVPKIINAGDIWPWSVPVEGCPRLCVDVWYAFYFDPAITTSKTANTKVGERPWYDGASANAQKDDFSFHYQFQSKQPKVTLEGGLKGSDVSVSADRHRLYFSLVPGAIQGWGTRQDVIIDDNGTIITLKKSSPPARLAGKTSVSFGSSISEGLASLTASMMIAVADAFSRLPSVPVVAPNTDQAHFDIVYAALKTAVDAHGQICRKMAARYHDPNGIYAGNPDILARPLDFAAVTAGYVNYYDRPPIDGPGEPPAPGWATGMGDWSNTSSPLGRGPLIADAAHWFASEVLGTARTFGLRLASSDPPRDQWQKFVDLLAQYVNGFAGLVALPVKPEPARGDVRHINSDPISLDEIVLQMDRLQNLFPGFCRKRLLGNSSDKTTLIYMLDVVKDVDQTDLSIDTELGIEPLRGLLVIGTVHGNEPASGEALIAAVQRFASAALVAECAYEGWSSMDDVRKTTATVECIADWLRSGAQHNYKMDLALADLYEIIANLHLMVVPVVNTGNYTKRDATGALDKSGRYTPAGVNINCNYKVLFKGYRDYAARQAYFFTPTGSEITDKDELGRAGIRIEVPGGDAEQGETALVAKLMAKKVEIFFDIHNGYTPQIVYPWGFWPQSPTVSKVTNRYCNPYFDTLGAGRPPATGYAEYIPQGTLDNHVALAKELADALKAANPSTGSDTAAQSIYYTGQATNYQDGSATPGNDKTGGGSIDYFLSLDLYNAWALNIEGGGEGARYQWVANADATTILFSAGSYLLKRIRAATAPARDTTGMTDWQRSQSHP